MAEKSGKKKAKKATKAAADPSVLGNLRSTRPTRLGGERRGSTAGAAAAKTSTATKPAAAKSSKAKSSKSARSAATKSARPAATKSARSAPPAGWQTPDQDGGRKSGPPSGTELVTTTVQAVGELAQIGATLTGRLLKRAADRLPRR